MEISNDLKELFPTHDQKADDRPVYYLWVYDPQTAKVHIASGETKHPADFPTHESMADHVKHPERMQGYAYSIVDGWRITDEDHHKVEDPFIIKRIQAALRQEHPLPPLPHIRYHGDPHPGEHQPLLATAMREGRITGGGLPSPGSRKLRTQDQEGQR